MGSTLSVADVVAGVRRIHGAIGPIRDLLNAADRVLGDGDTGMTIATVVDAWCGALDEPAADVGALFTRLGRATRTASGSSLAAVLAIGLTAAGRAMAGQANADHAVLAGALGTAATAIGERSGATPGDKSILDSILAIRAALAAAADGDDLATVAIGGAHRALEEFRTRQAKLGRARIFGEKTIGLDDPGMLAAHALLRAATTDGG